MKLRTTAIKSLAFAAFLGAASFLGFTADSVKASETAAAAKIVFDGNEAKITSEDGKFWGIAKEVKDATKADVTVGGKHYDIMDVEPVYGSEIDLSFLSQSKENAIAVGKTMDFTAQNNWNVKVIPKANVDFKVGHVNGLEDTNAYFSGAKISSASYINGGEYGVLVATDGKPGAEYNLKTNGKDVQIKVGSGDWKKLNEFFGKQGDAAIEDTDKKAEKYIHKLLQKGSVASFRLAGTADKWPSKEVKVTFSSKKKAPKVTVDTTKETTGIKKGMEYMVKVDEAEYPSDWTKAEAKVDFKTLNIENTKKYEIKVRSATKGKNIASKVTVIKLAKQDAPTVTQNLTGSSDVVANKVSLKVKVPYDIKKGIELFNNSKEEYELYLSRSGAEPTEDAKWLTLKAGKVDKKKSKVGTEVIRPSKLALKYSEAEKDNTYGTPGENETSKLYLRLAGTKQDKEGNAKLKSVHGSAAFKVANVVQTLKVKGGTDMTVPVTVTAKTEKKEVVDIRVEGLTKVTGKPKVKVTEKLSGVSVSADKFTTGGNSKLIIKISKGAFKEASTGAKTFKFEVKAEGVKQEVTVNITVQ